LTRGIHSDFVHIGTSKVNFTPWFYSGFAFNQHLNIFPRVEWDIFEINQGNWWFTDQKRGRELEKITWRKKRGPCLDYITKRGSTRVGQTYFEERQREDACYSC